jgi:hypothetical protein
MLLIYPKFGLNPYSGLGHPSIASWRLFLRFSVVLIRTWWTIRQVDADRPRGHRGPSVRCLTARLFFMFVRVLERLSFDPFCRWIFCAQSLQTVHTRVPDSLCRGGRSACPLRTVCFSRCTTIGSGSNFGRFVPSSWIVRALLAESLHGHCGRSAWCSAECLSPSLVELCFRVALVRTCS